MSSQTILITGASGFIGRHLVRQALSRGHPVVAVVRTPGALGDIPPSTGLRIIVGELSRLGAGQLAGVDVCIHLAAHGVVRDGTDWEKCFQVNVTESLRFWRAAVAAGIRRFVLCGSCFEYGRAAERYDLIPADAPLEPTGAYHASKAAATMAALALAVEQGLALLVARPFHVFGEGEADSRLWPALRRAALAGEDFPMTAGAQVRDFTPVEQVASELLEAATKRALAPGRPVIVNIGTGRPVTVREFAEHWWRFWQAKGRLLPGALPYRPDEVMRYVPRLEKGGEHPPGSEP